MSGPSWRSTPFDFAADVTRGEAVGSISAAVGPLKTVRIKSRFVKQRPESAYGRLHVQLPLTSQYGSLGADESADRDGVTLDALRRPFC